MLLRVLALPQVPAVLLPALPQVLALLVLLRVLVPLRVLALLRVLVLVRVLALRLMALPQPI